MATQYKGAVLSTDLPAAIQPVAEKWTEALNVTVALFHSGVLSQEERTNTITLVMQAAAAVLDPYEPTMVERQNFALFFLSNLNTICDQYFEDKQAAEALR